LVIAFLMINSMREKSLSGTPVMQGRLGGSLKNKVKGRGNLPLADEEPAVAQSGRAAQHSGQKVYPLPVQPPIVKNPIPPVAAQRSMPAPQSDKTVTGIPVQPGADVTQIAARTSLGCLRITRAPAGVLSVGQRIALTQFPFTMGRKDAQLTINEASVSRLHAEIQYDAPLSVYTLTDLHSSNGTLLNGFALNGGQPARLEFGSRIQLGAQIEMTFEPYS